MYELALFAGAGGGILGGHILGWRTVCAVEFEPYAASILLARQDDGTLPPFPVWDDIRTFDGRPWAGLVDVVSGGFPCQDISCAGRGAGIDGERSGLWGEMFRVVREVGPRYVFVENSPMLTSRGLGRVLSDLASVGYDAEWLVLGADDVGAQHRRDRIWILAHTNRFLRREGTDGRGKTPCERPNCKPAGSDGQSQALAHAKSIGGGAFRQDSVEPFRPDRSSRSGEWSQQPLAHANGSRSRERARLPDEQRKEVPYSNRGSGSHAAAVADPDRHQTQGMVPGAQPVELGRPPGLHHREGGQPGIGWWQAEPHLGRVADGMAAGMDIHGTHAGLDLGRVAKGIRDRVGRLRCIGNGQVPACAAAAFLELMSRLSK